MGPLRVLLGLLAPPRCAACDRPCELEALLCERCTRGLAALRPPGGEPPEGIDAVWSLAPHEGPARALVAALKFRAQLPIASLAAVRMAALAPPPILVGRSVVPVPAAPSRRRSRGFDPAARIACEFAKQADLPLSACLRREGGPRQVGRPRAERLADPPRVRAAGAVPPSAVLVDDVMTTGATLGACAAALRVAGADGVTAVTFARTP